MFCFGSRSLVASHKHGVQCPFKLFKVKLAHGDCKQLSEKTV